MPKFSVGVLSYILGSILSVQIAFTLYHAMGRNVGRQGR